jgi:hypothetical protein
MASYFSGLYGSRVSKPGLTMVPLMASLMVLVLLAGCASTDRPSERQQRAAAYEAHVTGSIDETVFSRVRSWTPIGSEYIAIRSARGEYFLLTLDAVCSDRLRGGSPWRMELIQSTPNTLTRLDQVRLDGRNCRIQQIRRLDHEALKAALDEAGIRDSFLR